MLLIVSAHKIDTRFKICPASSSDPIATLRPRKQRLFHKDVPARVTLPSSHYGGLGEDALFFLVLLIHLQATKEKNEVCIRLCHQGGFTHYHRCRVRPKLLELRGKLQERSRQWQLDEISNRLCATDTMKCPNIRDCNRSAQHLQICFKSAKLT